MKKRFKEKLYIGYAFGNGGEALVYNFSTSFFMIYLTSVAGITPAIAGTISSIALLMEIVAGIIVGRLSDRSKCKYGRRRPYILISAIMTPISIILMFYNVTFSFKYKVAYYIFTGMIFWTAYSLFYIPYTALGAEIATEYDDRTKLRTVARFFGLFGTLVGFVVPLVLLGVLVELGFSKSIAWSIVTTIIGILAFYGYFLCWRITRGSENLSINENNNFEHIIDIKGILSDFAELLKLKTMKIALIYKLFFTFAFTLFSASMIFFLQYRLQLKNDITSTIYIALVLCGLILTPFIEKIALKFGKKTQQVGAMFIAGFGGVVLYFIGVNDYAMVIIYVSLFSFAQTSFWQLSNAIFYDITEIDEFVYKKRREGDISCIQSVVGTIGTAATIQCMGLILDLSGFDANNEIQPILAISSLEWIFVLLPSIGLILCGMTIFVFPITKLRFNALLKAINLRKGDQSYNDIFDTIKKML